jgi:hypothetical protein
MDAPKPIESVDSVLFETRKILRSALGLSVSFGDKIHGPRPSSEDGIADGPDCLRSLASDLRHLATSVQNELQDHHNALGFERNPIGQAQPARTALR